MPRRSKKQKASKLQSLPNETAAASPSRNTLWWHLLVLLAISIGVYANSLSNGFVSDDDFQILSNRFITDTRYIPQLLTSNVWSFAQSQQTNYYRPVFMLLYMAEYFAFGYDAFYWHLVNFVFHLASLAAVYFLLRALAGEKLALLAALLFALHPIHVEAVVWVAVLTDLVCGLALFAAVFFYHRVREGQAATMNLALAAFAFAIGLLVKETAFVFPALLAAYEFFYRRESISAMLRGWRRYVPFAAVLALYFPARLYALGGQFAPSSGAHFKLTVGEMILSIPALFAQYVWKLFVPLNLNYYYVFEPVRSFGWQTAVGLVLIAGLVVLMFLLRARQPMVAFSIAWFFLTLAPVMSISNVGENVFTERYLYVPSLGFCAIAAWGWLELRKRWPQPFAQLTLVAALIVLCVFYAAVIVRRNPEWKDDITLFTRTAEQSPHSATIQMNLGYIWFLHGRNDLAIDYYNRSLALDANRALTHNNLGNSLVAVGKHDEAISHLRRALELKPDYWSAALNLGLAFAAKQEWNAAIESYNAALKLKPDFPEAWTALGLGLWNTRRPQEAIEAYRKAIAANPDYLEARINLAAALSETGAPDEAIEHLQHALRVNPRGPHASVIHFNLGINYERKQLWRAALREYENSLSANPAFALARQRADAVRPRVSADVPPLVSPLNLPHR
jgi:tetratricopeptide (TPR) repeat protein